MNRKNYKKAKETFEITAQEEINAVKEQALDYVRKYQETYKDETKSKDDLKEAAHAAIRALTALVDALTTQNNELILAGKELANYIQATESETHTHTKVN